MPTPEAPEAQLSRVLHAQFDGVVASSALRTRIQLAVEQNGPIGGADRPHRIHSRWLVPVSAALAVVVVAVTTVLILIHPGDNASTPGPTPSATAPSATQGGPALNVEEACADPQREFARFWVLMMGPDSDKIYQRKVDIGGTTVPSMAIYVGGAPAGEGVLCASDVADPPGLRDSLQPRAGRIGYVGHDREGVVWGAVRPGVTRVVIEQPPNSWTITPDGTRETQLQSLGGGWHAFTTGTAQGGGATFTVTAYDEAGDELDSVAVTENGATTASSAASSPG
jgi:hypothetical protein